MNRPLKHLPLVLALLLLSVELVSCGSSSITPVGRTKILGMHEYDEYMGMPIVRLSNNHVATGTYAKDSVRLDCYASDMTPAWHRAFGFERDEYWSPALHVHDNHLVAIGGASWNDGDTVGLRAMVLDPATGNTLKEAVPFRQVAPEKRSKRGSFHVVISPDSSKLFFYQIKYDHAIGVKTGRYATIDGYVYTLDLTQLGFGSLRVNIPDDVDDDDLEDDRYTSGVSLDNDGNFYEITSIRPNRLAVQQHNLKLHTTTELDTTFDKIDLKENEYAIRSVQPVFDKPGRMTVSFVRMKDKSTVDAFVVGVYDFNSGKVVKTVAHMPTSKQLEAWFDDDEAENYDITHALYTDEPKMLVLIAEKNKTHEVTVTSTDSKGFVTGMRTYTVYDKGETIVMGFDSTFRLQFESALNKSQETERGTADLSFVTRTLPNKLELFYVDRKEDGLFRCDVALPSGTLSQPQKIVEMGSAASLVRDGTLWDNENECYLMFWQGAMLPTVTLFKLGM